MNTFFSASLFWGLILSLASYRIGLLIYHKSKFIFCNPLLISIFLCISFLLLFKIPYADYAQSADYLSYLLTPATVCLAVPLYQQLSLLRKNWLAITLSCLSGVFASMCSVYVFSRFFSFPLSAYISLLPKSVTTAIGISLCKEFGGIPAFSASAIILTGILGNIFAQTLCRLFHISHPIARGLAIGCCSHAIGTSKALEFGQTEGAISSLAIAVSGIFTALLMGMFTLLPYS